MKVCLTFFVLSFACSTFTIAQGSYRPGYVVTSNGDTVKGDIRYRSWSQNPSKFSFRNNKGEIRDYALKDAEIVCINGRATYKRFVVWISQDRYVDMNQPRGLDDAVGVDSTKKLDTVFLKLIVPGKNVSLYSYTDFTKKRFYIGEKGKMPTELVLHKYYEQEPKLKLVEDRKYRIQLQVLRSVYAADNTALIDAIQLADYNEGDLKPIAEKLNRR